MSEKKEKVSEASHAADEDSTEVRVEGIEPDEKASESEDRPAVEEEKKEELTESRLEEKEDRAEAEPEVEVDWEDRFLRLAAEFENYKKRTAREYLQLIKSADEQLITELTEVLDNLERALDPEHRNARLEEFVKGIDLLYGQFKSVLEKRGLARIDAVGEPFDPEKHEAMMQVDSDDVPEGHITGEIAAGYMLGDKVIRHSKVMVSRGPAKKEKDEPKEKEEET